MKLSKKDREQLRMMFGGKCAYCGCELPAKGWHADHVEPVQRVMRYARHPKTGYGMMVATGEVYCPERDTLENLFPSCQPCNIHKGPYSLEGWRKELERVTGILQRGYPTYRHAVRFGQVVEKPGPIVFWFEKYQSEKEINTMAIEGMIVMEEGNTTTVVGVTGTDLECEGCEAKVSELLETDDSVMLCKPCFDECAGETEEVAAPPTDGAA